MLRDKIRGAKALLGNLLMTLRFYLFLWKLGILLEYIRAVKDNDINGEYHSVFMKLCRGLDPRELISRSFSFARQMFVIHSETDWWRVEHVWKATIYSKQKEG